MNNGDAILAAVLSLRDGVEQSFNRLEARVSALETRLDRFEAKMLQRFDMLEARLIAVEGH